MSIINLNKDNFDEIINQSNVVLVDCWAVWCDICNKFKPVFENVAEADANSIHTFAMLDTMQEKELSKEMNIEHIPTLLLYRDGILLFKQSGYFDKEKINDILTQASNLDMNLVRKELETEKLS